LNPNDKNDMQRFARILDRDEGRLQCFRDDAVRFIKQYTGGHYGQGGASKGVPVNFLRASLDTYTMHCVGPNIKASVRAKVQKLKAKAAMLKLALDHLIHDVELTRTVERCIQGAHFGVGVAKVAMNKSGTVEVDGYLCDVGQPYVSYISLDDLVFDTTATRVEDIEYIGNRYKMRKDRAASCGLFVPELIEKATVEATRTTNKRGGSRAAAISVGANSRQEDLHDSIYLWDIWFPQDGLLITVLDSDRSKQVRKPDMLAWDGPEKGPYHWLGFGEVPDNVFPLCTASGLIDLHEEMNDLWRKFSRQARRQKTLLAFRRGKAEDATTLKDADDGDAVGLDAPGEAKEIRFGGPDQVNAAFFTLMRAMFNLVGRNWEQLGGMRAAAPTLGQDQLSTAGAAKTTSEMKRRVLNFVKGILRDLAWYLWTDETIDLPLTMRVAGTDVSVPVSWTPEQREGKFLDYDVDVVPYSMQDLSPDALAQALGKVLGQFILPMMPLMQAQGIGLKIEEILRIFGEGFGLPVDDIIQFLTPSQREMLGAVSERGQKPATTTRNEVRQTQPAKGTMQSADDQMTALLSGAKPREIAEGAGVTM